MPVAIGAAITAVLSAGPIVTFLVRAAISIGLSLIAGQLLRKQSPLPTPSDSQSEIKQPLSPRVRSYGTVRVGGLVFWFSAVDRVLYKGLAINHGRIGSIVSLHIDENRVDIDVNDEVTTTPYSTQAIFIHSRLGETPETSYTELEALTGLSNLRGDGVATLLGVIENPTSGADFQNMFPSGQPELRATIEASVVYDPRDTSQSRDDPSTWQFSDNAVVCLMDYITNVDGYGIPWAKVAGNLAQWIEAMDICDELVPLQAGGFTRRYRVAGSYQLTDVPRDVVAKFESTCDGRVWVRRDGTIGIVVGKFPTDLNSIVQLTDVHVTGYENLTRGQDAIRSIQGIRAEYMSPEHDYREHEAEPWPTAADVLALGEDRTAALDLLWSPSNSQARRLMKRAYARAIATWHGTVHLNASILRLIDERYVRLTITELGIIDQMFEIGRFGFDPGGPSGTIDILSIDASIDDWDVSEEGTVEASTLSFVDHLETTGASLDLSAIAEVGEYCVICLSNNTGFPATPAGYDTLASGINDSTLHMKVVGRLVDGTETSVALQSAGGQILVQRWRGIQAAQVSELTQHSEATNSFSNTVATKATPFVVYAFASANDTIDNVDWLQLLSGDDKIAVEDHSYRLVPSPVSHVEFAVYLAGEQAPTGGFLASMQNDVGSAQGIISFNLSPG